MKHTLFLALICCSFCLAAQPTGALPGKCYANCYIADQFHTSTEQVMLKPPLKRSFPTKAEFRTESRQQEVQAGIARFEIIPPVYDTVIEKILVKPAIRKYVIKPAVYETVSTPVMTAPETKKLIPVPAVYETVTEQIMVDPGEMRYVETPPEFETVWESYESEPSYIKVVLHEPKYEIVSEAIEIKPATLKWLRRKGDPNCLQADPEDCFVWCLVEEPAEFQTVNKRKNLGCNASGEPDAGCVELIQVPAVMGKIQVRKLKTPASVRQEQAPPKYMTITRKVLRDSAYIREDTITEKQALLKNKVLRRPSEARVEEVPAEYLDVRKLVLKKPASYREIKGEPQFQTVQVKTLASPQISKTEVIPGEFITVAKRLLVRQGGFSDWREVLCEEKITGYTIRQIQSALKARGYDPGPVNNEMNTKTKNALRQFQLDNDLPVGNLDFESLNALGIKY